MQTFFDSIFILKSLMIKVRLKIADDFLKRVNLLVTSINSIISNLKPIIIWPNWRLIEIAHNERKSRAINKRLFRPTNVCLFSHQNSNQPLNSSSSPLFSERMRRRAFSVVSLQQNMRAQSLPLSNSIFASFASCFCAPWILPLDYPVMFNNLLIIIMFVLHNLLGVLARFRFLLSRLEGNDNFPCVNPPLELSAFTRHHHLPFIFEPRQCLLCLTRLNDCVIQHWR